MLARTVSAVLPIRGLTWREVRLLASAQLALVHAQFLLWQRPVGRLLTRPAASAGTAVLASAKEHAIVAEVATALDRAARRGIVRPRCLARAVALHRMLERRGVAGSVVRIGVCRNGDALLAHAWVDFRGRPLIDSAMVVANFALLTETQLAGLRSVST